MMIVEEVFLQLMCDSKYYKCNDYRTFD